MSDSSDVRIFIAKRDLTKKGLSGTSDDERGTLTVTDAGVAKSDSNIDQFRAEVGRCTFATNDLRYSGRLSRSQWAGLHGKGYEVMDTRFLPANANQFELEQDGQVGYLVYEIDG